MVAVKKFDVLEINVNRSKHSSSMIELSGRHEATCILFEEGSALKFSLRRTCWLGGDYGVDRMKGYFKVRFIWS